MDSEEKFGRVRLAPGEGRDEAGFTILETVIALCITMIIGFGSISLFIFSVSYNAGASERARAGALAQQQIEALRAVPYASLVNGDATAQVQLGSTTAGQSDRRTFTVRSQIEDAAGVSNARQKKITLTVTPAAAGRWSSEAVRLVTYRSSIDLGVTP
jgi:Tfp pilus assembly protein PilV